MKLLAHILTVFAFLAVGLPARADIVQSKSTSASSGNASLVLTSAPTVGNLILACIASGTNDPNTIGINTASWTVLAHGGTGNGGLAMIYRYAVGGDTATLPNMLTASGGFQAFEAIEVAGVAGTIGTDVEGTPTASYNRVTTPISVGPVTTLHNNDLGVLCSANYDGNGNMSLTGGASWIAKELNFNFGNYGSWGYWKSFVLTSGGSVSGSLTPNTTVGPTGYILAVLNGVGTVTTLEQTSKVNSYNVLQTGAPDKANASKANAYFILQYSSSSSKLNAYFVLSGGARNKLPFRTFP